MQNKFKDYRLPDSDAELIHKLIDSHCSALKNWIVTAVESEKNDKARELVRELRAYQDLYGTFNIKVQREIEARSN